MLIPLIHFKIIVVKGSHLVRNYTNGKISVLSAKIALFQYYNLDSLIRLQFIFYKKIHIKIEHLYTQKRIFTKVTLREIGHTIKMRDYHKFVIPEESSQHCRDL